MNRLTVSVVICAYTEDRWDELVCALEGVRSQTVGVAEIILVIDHNEALLQRVAASFLDVLVMANGEQRGLSGARNTGIAAASGDIVVFMDEDAVPARDWLERLIVHFASEDVVGVGGAIRPYWLQTRPGWFPSEFDWVVGCTYTGMPLVPSEVRNLIGCNMAFRRWVFDSAGIFRDGIGRVGTLPVGCEETELCIRVRQRLPGARMLYDPNAVVDHRVPPTRARFSYFVNRCYSEGLSKALITRYIGRQDALASERTYTVRTLPLGVLGGLRDGLRRDLYGIMRAGAIVIGFACTVAGYVVGTAAFTLKGNTRQVASQEVAARS